jgi:type IV secretory pathway VirD2 relaxase
MHHARMSGVRKRRVVGFGTATTHARPYSQRCAVRVLYSKNTSKGQWRAHGRYVARETATQERDPRAVGFSASHEGIDIAIRLEEWQKASDQRMWKLIVSPEFGDRVDLKRLTRDLMSEMQADLGMPLEWIAVSHYNTEHPHVHIALRGVGAEGRSVRLSRDYIRGGIREAAENLCTRQLGYRTEFHAGDSQRREVHQRRYTSLDRIIQRGADNGGEPDSPFFTITKDPSRAGLGPRISLTERRAAERLMVLTSMGLAESKGPKTWRVRRDFENVLRAMQRSADHQKTLVAHGAVMSDDRLPLLVLDFREFATVEGRILVHGEEETSGRSYLMLEGTDARVHYVYYTPEIEAARNRGGLQTNSFIRLRKLFSDGRPALEIEEFGDAESILRNKRHLREAAQRLIRRGVIPKMTVGMDGLVVIGRRLRKRLPRSNSNVPRGKPSAKRGETLAAKQNSSLSDLADRLPGQQGCHAARVNSFRLGYEDGRCTGSASVQLEMLAFCQLNYSRSADSLNIAQTATCGQRQNPPA